jgi:chromosomal replication initiation ATPase DnaA
MAADRRTPQIPLPLAFRPALGRADFVVTAANADAVDWVDRWPAWPGPALVLQGPAGGGKSHLAAVWAARARARRVPPGTLDDPGLILEPVLVDGLDPWLGEAGAETALFHLHNAVAEAGQSLLITMRMHPGAAEFRLPDLASRIRAAPVAAIGPPDDALLAAVLAKLFADRQVDAQEGCIAYLLPRMERSFVAARAIVARADAVALAERAQVTIPLLRRVLAEMQGRGG